MELGKCKTCNKSILYLETRAHIQFGGYPPPVQLDDLCPSCWVKKHPGEKAPCLPGWDFEFEQAKRPKKKR